MTIYNIIQRKGVGAKITRSAFVTFILVAYLFGVSGIGETFAYYNDTEESSANIFTAGEVDFLLHASNFTPTTTAVSLSPGDITVKNIDIDREDSNPFKYTASTTNVTGDLDFCNVLEVDATVEGLDMYNGGLANMLTDATTTLDSWEFIIGMGVHNFQNSICNFDIEYFGSQTRHDYPLGGGYNDTEVVENTIASWGFRINKVYYDVAPDRGKEGTHEWVEIYNQTNVDLDISGWEICDNTSCDTLPTTPLIPAQEYAIIVATSTTATSTTVSDGIPAYWYLPNEVTEINIDSPIGNGLGNNGDRLILKRPDGVVVDEMNWQDDTGVWDPGSVDVAAGNVLARVPSGYDTNQPSDFTELVPPSVDLLYPDEAGSYVWYWGYNYEILWTALNNNGDDEDLNIKIFYVKDVNGDQEINDGDSMFTIAETTANDGSYTWTVPSGFIGYIWIYLVATGPENPMLNSGAISGDILDPIPLFIGAEGVDPETVDMEAPVVTINGDNPTYVELGAPYVELGATATDNVDVGLGVNATGTIDVHMLGEYEITYMATDSAGNIGEATRLVVVYDPEVGIPVVEEEETAGGTSVSTVSLEATLEEETATITSDATEEGSTASSTPEVVLEDETSTTSPEVILEEDIVPVSEEIIPEEDTALASEEIVLDATTEETPVEEQTVEEPAIEPEPVIVEESVIEPEPEPEPESIPEPRPEPVPTE